MLEVLVAAGFTPVALQLAMKAESVETAKPGVLKLVPPPPLKGLPTPLGGTVGMAAGLKTETSPQVCDASSVAGIVAAICVALTLEVARAVCEPLAFQFTVEPPVGSEEGIKLVPEMVSVTAALPGFAEAGEMELRTGRGLGGGLMMKARVFDRPLFPLPECELNVLTLAVPGMAISAAGTTALRFTTLLLASRVGVVARFLPFHWAIVVVSKGLPNRVMVRSLPFGPSALMLAGEMAVRLAPVLP